MVNSCIWCSSIQIAFLYILKFYCVVVNFYSHVDVLKWCAWIVDYHHHHHILFMNQQLHTIVNKTKRGSQKILRSKLPYMVQGTWWLWPAFPLRKFFKVSLTHGPLNLCVNEKTVRVNDSPYFQFWSHTVPHPIPIKIIMPHWVIRPIIYYVTYVSTKVA